MQPSEMIHKCLHGTCISSQIVTSSSSSLAPLARKAGTILKRRQPTWWLHMMAPVNMSSVSHRSSSNTSPMVPSVNVASLAYHCTMTYAWTLREVISSLPVIILAYMHSAASELSYHNLHVYELATWLCYNYIHVCIFTCTSETKTSITSQLRTTRHKDKIARSNGVWLRGFPLYCHIHHVTDWYEHAWTWSVHVHVQWPCP